jgi:hypothetical protein
MIRGNERLTSMATAADACIVSQHARPKTKWERIACRDRAMQKERNDGGRMRNGAVVVGCRRSPRRSSESWSKITDCHRRCRPPSGNLNSRASKILSRGCSGYSTAFVPPYTRPKRPPPTPFSRPGCSAPPWSSWRKIVYMLME